MRVKTNPTLSFVDVIKFWPWLAVLSFLVLIIGILRLGSEPQSSEVQSDAVAVNLATAQQSTAAPVSAQESTVTPSLLQEPSVEVTVAAQVTEGAVNTAPNSRSPESSNTFSIKERANALIDWVSGLVSETPSANSSNTSATPPSSTVISTTPKQAVIDPAVEAPVADGEVDPVPVVSHLPVAYGEVKNQDRVHAGDDSMFLKDEGQ